MRFLIILLLLSSCSLERKITRAKMLAYEHPEKFASFCAGVYPPIVTIGKTITQTDTVYSNKIDSVPCPPDTSGKTTKVPCPPTKIIKQKSVRIDTVENRAKIDVLSKQLSVAEEKNNNYQNRIDGLTKKITSQKLMLYLIMAAVLFILYLKSKIN